MSSIPEKDVLVDSSVQKERRDVLIYGFEEPGFGQNELNPLFQEKEWMNANDQSIMAWMKSESYEPSVLVAHASTCRGFEWPTVITISM